MNPQDSLDYWGSRLQKYGASVSAIENRFGDRFDVVGNHVPAALAGCPRLGGAQQRKAAARAHPEPQLRTRAGGVRDTRMAGWKRGLDAPQGLTQIRLRSASIASTGARIERIARAMYSL